MEAQKRLLYIDNIRLIVIMLVVIMQLSLTYGGSGSWYYTEGRILSGGEESFFSFIQTFLQSFLMGFLLLIAGYFVPRSYDRKGFGLFLKGRAVRLGIPALLFMLVFDPVIRYALLDDRMSFGAFYADNITSLRFLSGSGPLWFALVLLAFSFIYAVVRRLLGKAWSSPSKGVSPNAAMLLLLILAIALLTFLFRIPFPVGTSVLGMPLWCFAQYIVLFTAGIFAYRFDLFSQLKRGYMGLLYTWPLWGPGVWVALMMAVQGFWRGNYGLLDGGGTWHSLVFALWESFTAVAMSTGLLVLFRDYFNAQNRLMQALSGSAFAVYFFHAPVVVAVTLLFQPVSWSPFAKFAAMIPVCLAACFTVSYALTKVPVLKKIL